MILQITGADWSETVSWVEQNGGWTQRSSDRHVLSAHAGWGLDWLLAVLLVAQLGAEG